MSDFLDNIIDETKAKQYIEQGSPEWDTIRVGRFTASEIWKLMVEPKTNEAKESGKLSETALTYITEKAAEVMTGTVKQQGYAFPLVWGKEKEYEAKDFFIQSTGLIYEPCGFYPYTDHSGGSPDGLIGEDDILEVKCPYDSAKQLDYLTMTDHFDVLRNYREIYWQCQANLLFTNRKQCHLVTFDPRMISDKHKMTHTIIPANSEHHDVIIQKITRAIKEKLQILNRLK